MHTIVMLKTVKHTACFPIEPAYTPQLPSDEHTQKCGARAVYSRPDRVVVVGVAQAPFACIGERGQNDRRHFDVLKPCPSSQNTRLDKEAF